jgi:hypothetical protein
MTNQQREDVDFRMAAAIEDVRIVGVRRSFQSPTNNIAQRLAPGGVSGPAGYLSPPPSLMPSSPSPRPIGFAVTHHYPNRLLVDVAASVATIEKAFGVALNSYHHKSQGARLGQTDTH